MKAHAHIDDPDKVSPFGPKPKYPFRTMEVGEVFFASNAPKNFDGYASFYGRTLGKKFRTKTVEGGKTLRRIA